MMITTVTARNERRAVCAAMTGAVSFVTPASA